MAEAVVLGTTQYQFESGRRHQNSKRGPDHMERTAAYRRKQEAKAKKHNEVPKTKIKQKQKETKYIYKASLTEE